MTDPKPDTRVITITLPVADDAAEYVAHVAEQLAEGYTSGHVAAGHHWTEDFTDGRVRNLARFTTEDAETVLGRPLTEDEYQRIVKTLEHSSMGEVFAECIDLAADAADD